MNLVIRLLFSFAISLLMTKDPIAILGMPTEHMLPGPSLTSRSLCAHEADFRGNCIQNRSRTTRKLEASTMNILLSQKKGKIPIRRRIAARQFGDASNCVFGTDFGGNCLTPRNRSNPNIKIRNRDKFLLPLNDTIIVGRRPDERTLIGFNPFETPSNCTLGTDSRGNCLTARKRNIPNVMLNLMKILYYAVL
ncbi:unnamed protein product [Allacma fusca]|uniref:Uncharacterized protein n=1 Tax=Allacma fusca TaxID=39272 RepID=A0A8J2LDL9_9HEXA|nr:unnamed protein product [Allacma fusca]